MSYLFTSESGSEGHPDKISDQISDALLDHFLAFDPEAKVACETLVTTGQVVLAGEVKTTTYLDVQQIARDVIEKTVPEMTVEQFVQATCYSKINSDIMAAFKKVIRVRHVGLEKVKLIRTAEKETVLLEA